MKFVLLVLIVHGQKINYYKHKDVVFDTYDDCLTVAMQLNRQESKKKSNVIYMCYNNQLLLT